MEPLQEDGDPVVLLEFPDIVKAKAFHSYGSPEYGKILAGAGHPGRIVLPMPLMWSPS